MASVVSPGFGEIRVIEQGGEPWFVAADVCRAVELANTIITLDRLDDDERSKFNLGRQGDDKGVSQITTPTPPPAAPLRPPGAGWYLYPPAEMEAFVGPLWAAGGTPDLCGLTFLLILRFFVPVFFYPNMHIDLHIAHY